MVGTDTLQASLCTSSCCFLNHYDILTKHRNWSSLGHRILQDYLLSAVLPSIWLKNRKHFLCVSEPEAAGDFVEHKILCVHCMCFKKLSPSPRQAPSRTLQHLLHTNLEPGMLVLSWLLGSSSNTLHQKTLYFWFPSLSTAPSTAQFLVYAREISKTPGSKTTDQGFLVLYQKVVLRGHWVKGLRLQFAHQPPLVLWICSQANSFWVPHLPASHPLAPVSHVPLGKLCDGQCHSWVQKRGIKDSFHAKLLSQ